MAEFPEKDNDPGTIDVPFFKTIDIALFIPDVKSRLKVTIKAVVTGTVVAPFTGTADKIFSS